MNLFNMWPEKWLHFVRSALLLVWGLLILSLIAPGFGVIDLRPEICDEIDYCTSTSGNSIFWNIMLPWLLIIVIISHDFWRRICPLSFFSQIFRSLGIQRKIIGRNGKSQIASVNENSWLAKHHFQLQMGLLISAVTLRLLVLNSSALGLGVLFILTLLASAITGWAYSGKTWCNYICPVGAAETIITGPRGSLGSNAHLNSPTKTTQSMCRKVPDTPNKPDASNCVACIKPCIDIDSERTYWTNITGLRGLNWAWYAYPGLVIGFFLLIYFTGPTGTSSLGYHYIDTSLYTYDSRLSTLAFDSFLPAGMPFIPRIIAIPLLITAACTASQAFFKQIERYQKRALERKDANEPLITSIHRTRLLATFTAVNAYFLFKGNPLDLQGRWPNSFTDVLIVALTTYWVIRSWNRSQDLYQRESLSASLRRQLSKLALNLENILSGRKLDDLGPEEVYVLAKTLPEQSRSEHRRLYFEVTKDQFEQGNLDTLSSLSKLADLRNILDLTEEDHFSTIQELSSEFPTLETLKPKEIAGIALKKSAAKEAILDLLELSGLGSIEEALQTPRLKSKIDRLKYEFKLEQSDWELILDEFSSGSSLILSKLNSITIQIQNLLTLRQSLLISSEDRACALPLIQAINLTIASLLPNYSRLCQLLTDEVLDQLEVKVADLVATLPDDSFVYLDREAEASRWLNNLLLSAKQISPIEINIVSFEEALNSTATSYNLDISESTRNWARMVLSDEAIAGPAVVKLNSTQGGRLLLSYLLPETVLECLPHCRVESWDPYELIDFGIDEICIVIDGDLEYHKNINYLKIGNKPSCIIMIGLLDFFDKNAIRSNSYADMNASEEGCTGLIITYSSFRKLISSSPVLERKMLVHFSRLASVS